MDVDKSKFILDVTRLKAARKIVLDSEIVEKTGVNKSALSAYLNAESKLAPSKPFIKKFYQAFGDDLKHLGEPEVKYVSEGEHYKELYMLSKQHIDALNRKAQLQEEIIALLEDKLDNNNR